MKIRNPARHYPSYQVGVYLKDGQKLNVRGSAQPEINLPFDEDDVKVLVVEILDAGRNVVMTQLLVDGEWSDYSAEALEYALNPPASEDIEPKPESEPEPAPEPDPHPELPTYEVDEEATKKLSESKLNPEPEPERNEYGLGCT